VQKKDAESILKLTAKILKKNTKGVVMYGTAGFQSGTAVVMYETESKNKILDSISLNAYAGTDWNRESHLGIGIEKKILTIKNVVDIGGGVYATRKVKHFFDKNKGMDFNIALSGQWKF
jgi:hypothetical protein